MMMIPKKSKEDRYMIISEIVKNNIWHEVKKANSIAISGHVRPDGDCIGACLGMKTYINNRYPDKSVSVYLTEKPGDIFRFLKGVDEIITECDDTVYDLFFALDCGDEKRMEGIADICENAGFCINIDHHATNTLFGDINCVDGNRSSTCELLYELMNDNYVDRYVAENLYTGIIHDTGVLKYSSTSARTMEIAGKLTEKGINFTKIIDESFYEKTYTQNMLLGRCLIESKLLFDGRFIMSEATVDIMKEYGAVTADLEGIVSALLLTKGVECSLLVHHMEDNTYKISLRSKNELDVSKIALAFGGGGHVQAAGATIFGDYQKEMERLLGLIKEGLDNIGSN